MIRTSIIKLIVALTSQEKLKIKKIVESSYFSSNEHVKKLCFFLLSKEYFSINNISKEKVFEYVYPDEVFNGSKLRALTSLLLDLIEKSLVIEYNSQNKTRQKIILAKILRRKELQDLAEKTLQEAKQDSTNPVDISTTVLLNEYFWQEEKYEIDAVNKRYQDFNLQEVTDSLDNYYIAEKLRHACAMVTHARMYKKQYEIGLIEPIVSLVENRLSFYSWQVQIYYYAYKCVNSTDNPANMALLQQQMQDHETFLSLKQQQFLYIVLINFCIQGINRGKQEYRSYLLEIYKKGMSKDILLEKGKLSRFTYKNIITIALNQKQYDWAKAFLEKYYTYLDAEQEQYYKFALSKYYYETGKYSLALKALLNVDFDDLLLTLSTKMLIIKIYYEKDKIDSLETTIHAFKKYLSRKDILGYHKESYKFALTIINQLLQPDLSKTQLQEIKTNVLASKVSEKEWLLQQIDKWKKG